MVARSRFGDDLMSMAFRGVCGQPASRKHILLGIGLSDGRSPFRRDPHLSAGLISRKLLVIRKLRVLL